MAIWIDGLPEKVYTGISKTVSANNNVDAYKFGDDKVIKSIYFNLKNVDEGNKDKIEMSIHAGTKERTFFDGTLLDLLVVSFYQNGRNLIDLSNKTYRANITFDYDNDNIATPLIPYLMPISISIYNKTGNDVDVKFAFEGSDAEDIINWYKGALSNGLKRIPNDNEIKTAMMHDFVKRRFISRRETLTATEQGFQLPAGSGHYDRIVIYTVSGHIDRIKLSGLDDIVEENDMDVMSDLTFLKNNLNPTLSPVGQIAIIENLPAELNYQLRVYGEKDTVFKILTEKVI
jgi:hypothetical protein